MVAECGQRLIVLTYPVPPAEVTQFASKLGWGEYRVEIQYGQHIGPTVFTEEVQARLASDWEAEGPDPV